MNCAICGKDNQPGTRYCVHCGASLAAATAPRPVVPAAPASGTAGAAPEPTVIRKAATVASPAIPVYNAEPRKGGGRILVMIGIAALVIAGGYIGYKIFGGSADVKDSLARFDIPAPTKVEPPPAPAATLPAPAPAAATPVETPKPADEKSTPTTAAPPAIPAEAPKTPPPVVPKAEGKAESKAPPKAPAAAVTPTTPATASPSVRPQAVAAAPAPAAAPVEDHWAHFDDDLQNCKKESLFARIVCDQKVRLRYCNGYWGKVAQCPGNPTNPDKGQ